MMSTHGSKYQNPKGFKIDFELLQEFENGLDTIHPEESKVPCRVLGYGEISTVFEILVDGMGELAFKRMSIFETMDEMDKYLVTYQDYNRILVEEVGLNLPAYGYAAFVNQSGRPIFYIIQEKLPAPGIGSKAMHCLAHEDTLLMFQLMMRELYKVWQFNRRSPDYEIGIDGQASNWVILNFDPVRKNLDPQARLAYIDTSTPMMRYKGEEQMDPELFLRSAPAFLAWILRILFLKDVVDRYYDFRKVIIDLLANCCKEQKPELIPELVPIVNRFFENQAKSLNLEPIQEKEIMSYYNEDRWIWALYLWMRRIDRSIYRYILLKPYPYILPGHIKR
jgi:hypothetical protein